MKKFILSILFCVGFWATNFAVVYTWNGATSTAFNVGTNWTPNGIPGAGDDIIIVAAGNNCTLVANTSVTNVTTNSGTLNLGGFTLTSTGVNLFTAGAVQNGTFSSTVATSTTFAATNTTFAANCIVNITCGTIIINGGTFGGTTTLNQSGAGNSTGTGGATFNGTTTIENSGTGNFRTNLGITFNGTTQLKVSNSGYLLMELTGANTYNGNVTMTITAAGSGNLRSCFLGATNFNGNISVENTGTGYIYFCENAGATATLANTKTLSVGGAGFSSGRLYLYRFTQTGATAQSITTTGTSIVTVGPTTTFNGNVTFTATNFSTTNSTYNGNFTWTKNGGNNDACPGGNTFNGTTTFNNSSPGYQLMGNGIADTYNNDVVANNTGSERIILAYNSLGNAFNGNISVSQTGATATGIYLGWNTAGASATLANGKAVSIGGGGFTVSALVFSHFTQTGATAQTITTTGSSAVQFDVANTFNGVVTVTAPDIYVRGATFNAAANFTKTGGGSNHNNGNLNIFNSTCTINQQSNGGYFMLGYNSAEQFNDNITVSSTGTGGIYLGFSSGTGTPTLAAGKTVLVGGAGFNSGFLYFGTFTQLGNAAINLTFTGASTNLYFANSSLFGGAITSSSPGLFFNGATFNGTVTSTKTGASNDQGSGGNIFQTTSVFTNTGAGYLMFGNGTADTWNGDVTFTNTGSERILPCWTSAGNQFNGNITFNSTGSSLGINFCGNAAATAIQAATKSMSIGGPGFTAGYLILQRFTQNGNAAITLALDVASNYLQLGPSSSFGGSVTVTAPNIYPYGATYNGAASFTKTGGASNHNNGNLNIFNSTCTINQQSNGGYFMLGYNSAEVFNGDITVTSIGTGGIYLGYVNGTGTPTLAAGKTVLVGGAGFSAGFLSFGAFTQLGNAAMNLTFTGASTALYFTNNSLFGGNITSNTPDIYLNGATFNGTLTCTKTGAASDAGTGGNTFNQATTMNNTSAGYLMFGNGALDNWNADVTFNNSGSERILVAWNTAGNLFNGNITVTNTGSGLGINFCNGGASTATLAAGKTISIGGAGFNTGYLILPRFTQLGNAPINLTFTGATTYIQVGPSSAIGGDFTVVSPRILLNGATYSGNVNVTKNGATGEWSNGGNTFNGATTTINSTAAGFFGFANGASDIYNGDVFINNNGTERIIFANSSVGNQFNGNVTVTQIGGSVGIAFGWNAASLLTMAAGKTIFIGGGGYNVGYLQIERFTQLGNAAMNLTLTGTASLYLGPTSTFWGAVTAVAPDIWAQGSTYNGAATFTKTGGSNNHNQQNQNIFNSTCTINQQSNAGYFMLGYNSNDLFNDDITVTSIGTGGIYLGWVANAGTPTLAAGKTILVGGAGFNSGFLYMNTFTQLGNAPINLTFTGTASLTMARSSVYGGSFTASAPDIYVQGATFSSAANFTKTGGTNNHNNGNLNIFNSTCTINQQSNAGYFMLGYNSADAFNGDITVSSIGTGGIYLGYSSGTGTPTLAATKSIFVGGAGFSAGFLYFGTFTQLGSAPINLPFTGANTTLTFARSSLFGGNITSSSADLYFNGATFNGTVNSTKTGATNDAGSGTNIFNNTATMTNTGAGYLMFGNTNSDQFNADATFNNNGSSNIYVAYNSVGNVFGGNVVFNNAPTAAASFISVAQFSAGNSQFNGNITVTSTGNGTGVLFCSNTGTAILAAAKTITIGGAGFSIGQLLLRNFTQTGATAQSLTLTGTGNLTFGPSSAFGGNVTAVSPTLFFNGCTFSGRTTCTKNGTTNDGSAGNNIFTGISIMTNSGSGYLLFGNGTNDQWLTDVTFNNTGSNIIYAAYNSTNNTFGGNVTLNNTGSTAANSGIRFCEAASATAIITGNLIATNNPTSGANNGLRFAEGNSSSFTVNGTTTINSTGTNSANYIRFAQGTSSTVTFGGDVTVTNVGNGGGSTNVVHFGYTGATAFNGNVTLNNSVGTGVFGIYFGANNGTCTQADNKTINTSTYTAGLLSIRNFTQNGPTAGNTSNVSITGANFNLQLRSSSFYDNVIGSSQQIDVLNSTFRGAATLTKVSGNANDYWTGGNTFNGTTLITNQSTFILGMANGTADAYNGNVTFVQSNTGALRPNYNANCTYNGNITVTAPVATAITFGVAAAGIATMSGGNAQTINMTTGNTPIFTQLVMSKSALDVTLNCRINVSTSLTMTTGNIITTSANILNMNNAATTTIGNAASFVNGPMNYDMALNAGGGRTLNFPIGKASDWRPISLALLHNAATSYTYKAELTNAPATFLGWNLPATVDTVSGVHYWDVDRSITGGAASSAANLSGNQAITIYFDVNDGVFQGSNLTIVKNTNGSPTTWFDIGGNCALGNFATPQAGNVTSTSAPTAFNSFSRFTLGSKNTGWNSLPVDFLYFTAKPVGSDVALNWATASETNNDHFNIERSVDGSLFEYVSTVKANGTGNSIITQLYNGVDAKPYTGTSYYRLKQFDKNGAFKYSGIAEVNFTKKSYVSVYPNPAYSTLTIEASNDYINATVKITNALGEEVINTTLTSYSNLLDVSVLNSGFYFVTIDNGFGISKTKIMVQK